MPTSYKITRDVPVNFSPPGGGAVWSGDEYADDAAVTVDEGLGVIGLTVTRGGSYAVHLGFRETLGVINSGVWDTLANSSGTTVTLSPTVQYYVSGPSGAARQAKVMLGYRLSFRSSSSGDTSVKIYLRGLDISGVDDREELTLSGTSIVSSTRHLAEVVSLSKDETAGAVIVDDAQGYSFKLSPKQRESRFTRVELTQAPTEIKDMGVVFKKRVRDLLSDGDAPQVNSIEQALMAYALGDLYTKQRQLNKAQLKYQEASALLEVVRHREMIQQTRHVVMVPAHLGQHDVVDFGW